MPDIAMCSLDRCNRKTNCHRFIAKPNKYYQFYFVFNDSFDPDECEWFWLEDKDMENS